MAIAVPCAAAAQPQKFSIAVPDDDGLISLGVFDAKGKLVRVLEVLTPMENLTVGLNGLIMEWDGRDQSGKPAAPGKFFIRGWFIPADLVVEGEAFHFNSWINSEGIPPVASMNAIVPRAEGGFYLIGKEAGTQQPSYWAADYEGVLGTTRALPPGSTFLGGNSRAFVLARGNSTETLFFQPEEHRITGNFSKPAAAAAGGAGIMALLVDEGRGVEVVSESDPSVLQYRVSLPKPAKALAICADGVLAASESEVWFAKNAPPVSIPLGEILSIFSIASGPENSFWVAAKSPNYGVVVRNYDLTGELLRELKMVGDNGETTIFSDGRGLQFFLLGRTGSIEALSEYRAKEEPEQSSQDPSVSVTKEWEIFLTRSIEAAEKFGFENGEASAAGSSSDSIKIHLAESEFSSGVGSLILKPKIADSGVWLQAEDGLDLFAVWDEGDVNRVALSRGDSPDSLKILIGQPSYAAGFSITGLRKIVPLDAGEFEVSP